MSDRMTTALFRFVHESMHAAMTAIGEIVAERGEPKVMDAERLLGPIALGMFADGMEFGLSHPAAARAYVEMMRRDAKLDADDLAVQAEEFATLEAAWRPLQ